MNRTKLIFSCFIIAIAAALACNKDVTDQTKTNAIVNATERSAASLSLAATPCDLFAYTDTIFYLSAASSNYVVKPTKVQTGTYGAFPAGLSINSLNGSINVSTSETGLEYLVWFVPKGTTDTCKKYITISGVDYEDSVYVMSAPNGAKTTPIYNATLQTSVDCRGGCEFDDGVDDDNGNGTADEPPAGQELIPKGFVINKATGVIDLGKSIQNGVLGKNPVNGTFKNFTLYYRLGDKSTKALNHMSFQLYYYKTQAQIPASLKEEVAAKQSQVLVEGKEEGDDGHHGGDGGHHGGGKDGRSSFAASLTAASKKGGEVKCRPPYIIVTQQ